MKPRTLTPLQRLGGALLVVLAGLLLVPPGGWPVLAQQRLEPGDVVYTNTAPVTCGSSTTVLLAASTTAPREATFWIAPSADTGIYVGLGAAATSSMAMLLPGMSITVSGRQAINCLRAGSSNVTAYLLPGAPGSYAP